MTGQSPPETPRDEPRRIRRGGRYVRIAKVWWRNPLDGRFAERDGGRWNEPGSFPVVYLNATQAVARANVDRMLARIAVSWGDLQDEERPILVDTEVPEDDFLDVVTDEGCRSVRLPKTYPLDSRMREVAWSRCRPVGRWAFDAALAGVACRSASTPRPPYGEELAWYSREHARLVPLRRRVFADWYLRHDR